MGRKAIAIDKAKLEEAVLQAEAKAFSSQNQLFKHLGEQFSCAPAVIRGRILSFGIAIKTEKGVPLSKPAGSVGVAKAPRKGKASDYKIALAMVFNQDGMEKRVAMASKGSLKAAVSLKCYECAGFSKLEVRMCTCVGCPLFAYRPWVDKRSLTEEGRKTISSNANKEENSE